MRRMKNLKKWIAGILCAAVFAGSIPVVSVEAANTTTTKKTYTATTSDKVLALEAEAGGLNKGNEVKVSIKVPDSSKKIKEITGRFVYDTEVFETLTTIKVTDSGKEDNSSDWSRDYKEGSKELSVKKNNNTAVTGAAITMTLKVKKTVSDTQIRLDYADLKLVSESGSESDSYIQNLSVTVENTAAKKLTLTTNDVTGSTKLAVPYNFTANDGISEITITAKYNNTVLKNPTFTYVSIIESNKEKWTYNEEKDGDYTKVSATCKLKADISNKGVLFYVNFEPVKAATATAVPSEVILSVDNATNNAGDVFTRSSAVSIVYITTKSTSSSTTTYTLGDVNNDGKINLVDALYIVRYCKKTRTLTETELKAADVTKDNKVDLADATLILKKYNGESTSF